LDRDARLTSRRARLQWAALATGAVAAVALALKVVGVADDVEFLATLLVAPVVGATLLVDRNLGYVTAAIAAVAYLYLRFDDIQAAGAIGVVVLVAFRAGSYLFVAHLTPLLFDRFTGGASAGAGGGSSGRHLRAEAVDPWAPADDDLAPTSAYAPVGLADEPLVPLVPVGAGRSRYEPDPADAELARSWEDDALPVDDWGTEAAAYQAQEPPAPRVPTGWIDDATSPLGDEQIPVGFTGELFLGRITGATPVVGANGGGRNGAGSAAGVGVGAGAGTNGSGGPRPRAGARSYDRDVGYDDDDGWSTAPPSGAPVADPYGDDDYDRRRPAPAFSGAGDADPYDRRDEPRPPATYNGGDAEVDRYGYDRAGGLDRRDPGDDRLTEPMYGGPVDDQAVARSESLARPWATGGPAGTGAGAGPGAGPGGAGYDWPPAGASGRPDHAWDTTPPPGTPASWEEPPPTRPVPAVDPALRRPPTGPVPAVPTAAHPAAAADPRAYEPRPAPAPAVDPSAGIDPETRLWNAQFFRHRLNTAIEHSKRTANSFSVVMVQVADEPFQPLPYRRQVALLRELGHQFVPRFVDHLVHLPDGAQHWFAVVLVDTDRAGADAFEKRLSTTIAGYLRSRGLRVGDVQSASLTSPDDDEAMAAIWASLLGADTAAP
jgi:hypothetical protein